MRTIKFHTLGCKVNQYETQAIREQFLNSGFKELENSHPADFYVINTCTVTQGADSDSLNFIRRSRRENPKAKIIVTGCLTELDEDRIKKIDKKAVIIKKQQGLSPKGTVPKEGITYFKNHTRAFLKIQDGCNNFCSYCKVPLVRGPSRSRPLTEIIQEAKGLVKNGYKEIVLSGICLGAYGRDLDPKLNLVKVIEALEEIDGILRIRLSSIEAGDVTDELINKMSVSKKLCPHLHIPIQSGDDEILKKMNRRYCRKEYLNLIKKIKSRIPKVAITADILVGFPSESEDNFKNTVDLVKKILPLKVHIFSYSTRPGTRAFSFAGKVNPAIIKERMLRLKNITKDCSIAYKRQFFRRNMAVLIESRAKDNPQFWQGHTANYIPVLVKSNFDLKNQFICVKLNSNHNNQIAGYTED